MRVVATNTHQSEMNRTRQMGAVHTVPYILSPSQTLWLWIDTTKARTNVSRTYLKPTEPSQYQLDMCYPLRGCDIVYAHIFKYYLISVFCQSVAFFLGFFLLGNVFHYLSAKTLTTKLLLSWIWICMIRFIKWQMFEMFVCRCLTFVR